MRPLETSRGAESISAFKFWLAPWLQPYRSYLLLYPRVDCMFMSMAKGFLLPLSRPARARERGCQPGEFPSAPSFSLSLPLSDVLRIPMPPERVFFTLFLFFSESACYSIRSPHSNNPSSVPKIKSDHLFFLQLFAICPSFSFYIPG